MLARKYCSVAALQGIAGEVEKRPFLAPVAAA